MVECQHNKEQPHHCDKPGIPCNCGSRSHPMYIGGCNNWGDLSDDMTDQLVWAGVHQVTRPLMYLQGYMERKAYEAAKKYLPSDEKDFELYRRWAMEILRPYINMVVHVATRLALGIPARWTTLEGTLKAAMVNAGLCCEEAVNRLIEEEMGSDMKQLLESFPEFKREWATIKGYEDIPFPWSKPKAEA
jgi:hypothetical protein